MDVIRSIKVGDELTASAAESTKTERQAVLCKAKTKTGEQDFTSGQALLHWRLETREQVPAAQQAHLEGVQDQFR